MTTPLKTRILIADDHPIVLRGLRISSTKTVERHRATLSRTSPWTTASN
jgi:hypothetical protein